MNSERVLIVGSGGREDAMKWKLSGEGLEVYMAPGNGGTDIARRVLLNPKNHEEIVEASKDLEINLVIVGPEEPLVHGIVDRLHEHGVAAYGPTQQAARLEGSKTFSGQFLKRHDIPAPEFGAFDRFEEAVDFVTSPTWKSGVVVKADGLAAGKGVFVCNSLEEAYDALRRLMMDEEFGDAGKRVVIQEKLEGYELSAQAIVRGQQVIMLPFSEDYKQAHDNDSGPNTGGMGAEAPHPLVTQELSRHIQETIIEPIIVGMKSEGIPLNGTLYVGIMMTADGPKVLEINIRFGSPEIQSVLPLLALPLYPVLYCSATGRLPFTGEYPTTGRHCVVVTLASGGYPGSYETGFPITGLENIPDGESVLLFHDATREDNGTHLTAGGRVLMVAGVADSLSDAKGTVYQAVKKITFQGMQYRDDIGNRKRKNPL